MRFVVNFYIQIYKRPMLIIKNHEKSSKEIHLTYHEGQHYNSIRLKGEETSKQPSPIPLEKIGIDIGVGITKFTDNDLIDESPDITCENPDDFDPELIVALNESKKNEELKQAIDESRKWLAGYAT